MKNSEKTHCPQNHLYDKANTRISAKGGRFCRACDKAKATARRKETGPAGAALRQKNRDRVARWLAIPGNREKQNEAARLWQKSHREEVRDYHLQTMYGVTSEGYELLLKKQSGRCALCESLPGKQRLAVDHNHQTGQVRGLLCFPCNRFVGRCENNPFLVHRILQYLELEAVGQGKTRH